MDDHGVKDEPVEPGEIPQESAMDESSRLRELQADVRNQDDLEKDITREVSLPGRGPGLANDFRQIEC